ncbi:MAG: hypothetical protein EAY81_04205 [Bacteroidetes bacterium]|nr:MAG: hypothetical protein EAY81_04205 [Bacteroidota bacterium]
MNKMNPLYCPTKRTLTFIVMLAFFINVTTAQENGKFGIDVRVGMPTILATASPKLSPYGGLGFRYSFNEMFSTQLDFEGGGITGLSNQTAGYFRYTFIQPSLKFNFHATSLLKDRGEKSRLNGYLSLGIGNTVVFYDADKANDGSSEKGYFTYTLGINGRYYINEMLDIIGGTGFNFTGTTAIDNVRNNSKKDVFLLSYIGIGVKFLPTERAQAVEWKHLPLAFNNGPITATKEIVGNLEKQLKDAEKKGNDSITTVLRKEIALVDAKVNKVNTKVDSIDAKMNTVLEMLNKLANPPVDTTAQLTTKKGAKGKPTKGKKDAKVVPIPTTGKGKATTTRDSSSAQVNKLADTATKAISTPGGKSSSLIQDQVIDQSKVKESYAIVVGSFVQDQNALNTKERYVEKGWDAHILGNARSQYKRIVIFSNNYYEAAKIVTELRKTEQPDVWMLDINTGKGVYIK